MKILSPLRSVSEVDPLKTAGADEFYCGLAAPGWKKKVWGRPGQIAEIRSRRVCWTNRRYEK